MIKVKKTSSLKIFISLLLTVILAFSTTVYALDGMDSIQEKNKELVEEQQKIDEDLEAARKNISNQEELKKALEKKIKSVENNIDDLNIKIHSCNEEITKLTKEIQEKEKEIEEDYERLRNRIKIIYMAGDTSTLDLLFGSKDFSDFLDKVTLIKTLSNSDEKLINTLEKSIKEINKDKNKVTSDKEEVLLSKEKLETEKTNLTKLNKECDELLLKLEGSVTKLEDKQEENTKEQRELSDKIAALHTKYIENNIISLEGIDSNTTSYVWPAPGCNVVTAYWGDGRNHKGVDITCNGSSYGSPIVAAADGTAIIANNSDSWGGGWGYYTMIDHGGGFATQYAHCSYVAVKTGQTVKAGQIIGYIGNSGDSFGAHLHFECWYNGQRYNPAIRLGL